MPQDYLLKEITQQVAKTFATAGQAATIEQIGMISTEVTNDIHKSFAMLSIQEIELAFYHGVRYDYGEYFGINIVTFNRWLRHYLENHHFKYVQEITKGQKLLDVKTEPTDEEKERIVASGVNRCFQTWKATKMIIDYGNPVFDYLYQKGTIKLTDIEWENYVLKASIEVTTDLKMKSQSVDRIERQDAKRILSGLETNNEVESLAKRMALEDYFKKLAK